MSKNNFDKNLLDIKSETTDLYGSNYWKKIMLEEANVKSIEALIQQYLTGRTMYWFLKILEYSKANSSVLEVGCGLGSLSFLMKEFDYDVTATELSDEICEFLKMFWDINVWQGDFANIQRAFDFIVVLDVLEHITNPVQFMDNLNKKLNATGVVCIQTPCYDHSLSYDVMLREKPNFKKLLVHNQHSFIFSKESIKKLLHMLGLKYVLFEDAFFGNDYDMFLFASKKNIKKFILIFIRRN